jgi:hypothetical protein
MFFPAFSLQRLSKQFLQQSPSICPLLSPEAIVGEALKRREFLETHFVSCGITFKSREINNPSPPQEKIFVTFSSACQVGRLWPGFDVLPYKKALLTGNTGNSIVPRFDGILIAQNKARDDQSIQSFRGPMVRIPPFHSSVS